MVLDLFGAIIQMVHVLIIIIIIPFISSHHIIIISKDFTPLQHKKKNICKKFLQKLGFLRSI